MSAWHARLGRFGRLRPRWLPGGALLLACGLTLGLVAGWLLTSWLLGDRLVIGGTGQELSVLLEVAGRRVVIGGGSSRSDLVDFVDRSTLPWDRQIDLLVIPAWDERHLPGALELVERGRVRRLALLGLPGNEPAWTLLERAAQARQASVTFIAEPQRVTLTDSAWFTLHPSSDGSEDPGVHVLIRLGEVQIAVVDAPRGSGGHWRAIAGSHLLVTLRQPPGEPGPMPLVARPSPRRSGDFVPIDAQYELVLDRGRRVTLRFTGHELRVPLNAVDHLALPVTPTP
ncbi:hypothetical protein HRbin26_01499 [bacterium HR26]|nr:hypothetical protein HRbin26_01499 [bacterium HR26]